MGVIFAIDPGTIESGYVIYRSEKALKFGKVANDEVLQKLWCPYLGANPDVVVIEEMENYGHKVGKEVLNTVFWSGRFAQKCEEVKLPWKLVPRRRVKLHLCGKLNVKDSDVITALVNRLDPLRAYGKYGKGTEVDPGPFYGFSRDVWQAYALALTFDEMTGGQNDRY